jgi:hypothetical protein
MLDKLTYERLLEVLRYEPETGVFVWKVCRGRMKAGTVAGRLGVDGYYQIGIDKNLYFAHRLAWLYVYGYMPENSIDHINKVKGDNRIRNLREVSHQCNLRNSKRACNNTSGVCGVYWDKKCNKWRVGINVNYKNKYLGHYDDFDDAVCARLAAEQALNWEGCDSTSDAYCYVRDNIQGDTNAN